MTEELTPTQIARRNTAAKQREAFIADYEHFSGFGWTDVQIARRLGCQVESLRKRMQRNGVTRRKTPTELLLEKRLTMLLERGGTFCSIDFPDVSDENEVAVRLQTAARDGLIRRVGTRNDLMREYVVWEVVEQEDV